MEPRRRWIDDSLDRVPFCDVGVPGPQAVLAKGHLQSSGPRLVVIVDRCRARPRQDIARRVEAIQHDTSGAVAAIGRISEVIGQINDYQLTIASAVEEQTATTTEMPRSVGEAADGSGQIAVNIGGVSTAADTTDQALGQTRTAVDELTRMAADLRTAVGRFIC